METTTKQVRQILMNELGLTRESIRSLVNETVRDLVLEALNHRFHNGLEGKIDGVIESAISTHLAGYRDRETFKRTVSRIIVEQVKEHLIGQVSQIKISI